MGFIGLCGTKGYGFSAVLVINRVSILAIRIWGAGDVFLEEATSSSLSMRSSATE